MFKTTVESLKTKSKKASSLLRKIVTDLESTNEEISVLNNQKEEEKKRLQDETLELALMQGENQIAINNINKLLGKEE